MGYFCTMYSDHFDIGLAINSVFCNVGKSPIPPLYVFVLQV